MKRLPCKFQLGTLVYHTLSTEFTAGLITNIEFTAGGGVVYSVQWGIHANHPHYENELTSSPNLTQPHQRDPEPVSEE